MNDTEVFFDTNIIAYAFDEFDINKKKICEELVDKAFKGEIKGVVSNQVLSELFTVLTQKMGKHASKKTAAIIVESLIDSEKWVKINYEHTTVKKSLAQAKTINVSFWDILISETMKENGINKIYTEDEEHFKKISGIKAINPLKP